MPFNVKEENIALGLKYTVSALSHANLRACIHTFHNATISNPPAEDQ